jgi:hypothetical protein
MSTEKKILLTNVKSFRKRLLKEASNNDIIDAINGRKILYIYYSGDDTVLKGYRTIKPYVFGVHGDSGNEVLRAWQDAGSSDSYAGLTGRKRQGHEYSFDTKGRIKPGWRLFRVDKISSILPTGEKFSDTKAPEKYNPADKDMANIFASVTIQQKKSTEFKNIDTINQPDVVKTKSDFDTQTPGFKRFFKAAEKTRDVTKDEVRHLWDINKKIKKKSPNKMWVVQTEKGDMVLKDENVKNKLPPEQIVGNLKDLYTKFILPDVEKPTDFFNTQEKTIN